ncbi:DUF4405 domain-containing protein [Fibrella aquatica]|uniref:DUF4405 domain-containing protein n=1 Tax=Fibrella aquatica TaxID=3242487 RepID=UPI003521CACF
MKKKNLVSLMVSAVFAVLSISGLLIYFGRSNHTIDHTHAWFGMLFFSAAVFHIINNWSSIKGYSTDRRSGGVKRELIVAVVVVLVFVGGIAADLPVFKDLANAGKKAFGAGKPPKKELSKTAIDSIARQMVVSATQADVQTVRFDSTAALAENVIMAQGTAARATPDTGTFQFTEVLTLEGNQWKVAAHQTGPVK